MRSSDDRETGKPNVTTYLNLVPGVIKRLQKQIIAILWVGFLIVGLPLLALGEEPSLAADVIMKTDDRGIAACGIGFRLVQDNARYAVNVVIEKRGSDTLTKVIATSNEGSKPKAVSIRTLEFSTDKILQKVQPTAAQLIYAKALTPSNNARLFQQIMVSGARIEIEDNDRQYSWTFPGPASQSLRGMYLMCSGDMFRP